LQKKILTWDNFKNIASQGPRRCIFRKNNDETIPHLLKKCIFTTTIWEEALKMTRRKGKWQGGIVEVCLEI